MACMSPAHCVGCTSILYDMLAPGSGLAIIPGTGWPKEYFKHGLHFSWTAKGEGVKLYYNGNNVTSMSERMWRATECVLKKGRGKVKQLDDFVECLNSEENTQSKKSDRRIMLALIYPKV